MPALSSHPLPSAVASVAHCWLWVAAAAPAQGVRGRQEAERLRRALSWWLLSALPAGAGRVWLKGRHGQMEARVEGMGGSLAGVGCGSGVCCSGWSFAAFGVVKGKRTSQ